MRSWVVVLLLVWATPCLAAESARLFGQTVTQALRR